MAEKAASRDRIGQAAVAALNKAVDGGVQPPGFFRSSPQLAPVRDRDDFKDLLARIERPSGAGK